jgi:hypothetical protein
MRAYRDFLAAAEVEVFRHIELTQQDASAFAAQALAGERRVGKHGAGGKGDALALGNMEDMAEHGRTLRRHDEPVP